MSLYQYRVQFQENHDDPRDPAVADRDQCERIASLERAAGRTAVVQCRPNGRNTPCRDPWQEVSRW